MILPEGVPAPGFMGLRPKPHPALVVFNPTHLLRAANIFHKNTHMI